MFFSYKVRPLVILSAVLTLPLVAGIRISLPVIQCRELIELAGRRGLGKSPLEDYTRILREDEITQIRNPYREVIDRWEDFGLSREFLERGTLYNFESSIERLLSAPFLNASDLDRFASNWGLDFENMTAIVGYYRLHVMSDPNWANHMAVANAFSEYAINYFRLSDHPTARRYAQYREMITQYNVPEMARVFGITEGDVYEDLSLLRMSIVEAFSEIPSPARFDRGVQRLRQLIIATNRPATHLALMRSSLSLLEQSLILIRSAGLTIGEAAEVTGVGETALSYILHHEHFVARGESWQRILNYQGQPMIEDQILFDLHRNLGLKAADIAGRLNHLAGVNSPEAPAFRTQNSILQRLSELGLNRSFPNRNPNDVFDPAYGYLKLRNRINLLTTIRFILDHNTQSEPWLAQRIGVEVYTLREFLQRHQIESIATVDGRRRFQIRQRAEMLASLSLYERRLWIADAIIDWSLLHSRHPNRQEIERGEVPGITPRVFQSITERNPSSFWIFVKCRAEERGINFSLVSVKLRSPSAEFREAQKKEAVSIVVDWILRRRALGKGDIPHITDFSVSNKTGEQIPLTAMYFFGHAPNPGHRLFPNSSGAWLAVKREMIRRGHNFRLLDLHKIDVPTEEFLEERKQEALQSYFALSVELGGRWLMAKEVSDNVERLGFTYTTLYLTDHPLFRDKEEFERRIREYFSTRGIELGPMPQPRGGRR